MKVIVCCKIVPSENSIKFNGDRSLDFSNAEYEVSQYDLNAIEAASRIMAQCEGSSLAAVTVGGDCAAAPKMKKSILSRGPAELFAAADAGFAEMDALATAKLLKSAIELAGSADLVICGEGSGDMYNQQTGSMLGALLGVTTLNGISGLSMDGGTLIAERSVEDGVEVLKVSLPAVLSVTSDINLPRIPSMRDIMGAGKKPSAVYTAAETVPAANSIETRSILAPEKTERRKEIFFGNGDEAVNQFCDALGKLI